MPERYPPFVRHSLVQIELARGIGIDHERIEITRSWDGGALYVKLDRPKWEDMVNAGFWFSHKRPRGVEIVLYEGPQEWHQKLTLPREPWEDSPHDLRMRAMIERDLARQQDLAFQSFSRLMIPRDMLLGDRPSGLMG